MRKRFITFLLCFLFFCSLGAQSLVFKGLSLYNTDYRDSLQVLENLEASSLSQNQKAFVQKQLGSKPRGKFIELSMHNKKQERLSLYLRFCRLAESIHLFRFEGMQTEHFHCGTGFKDPSVSLPSSHHYLKMDLTEDEKAAVLLYLEFPTNIKEPHYTELFISEVSRVDQEYFKKVSGQHFYAGLILLIAFLSAFAAYWLRYRALSFFALHLIFWVPYFHLQLNLESVWTRALIVENYLDKSMLSIFFIILFASLFIVDYLKLWRWKAWFWPYFASHVLSLALLAYSIWQKPLAGLNFFLVGILLYNLVVCIKLSLAGNRAAKLLLASFSIVVLGGILSSLSQLGYLPTSAFSPYFFQIGTLLFSLLVFLAIAAAINKIRNERLETEQVLALKTQFFENVSHELRSPLSLVTDPLRRVWTNLPAGKDKEALGIAKRASEGLQNLVNQILALSSADFKPPEMNYQRLDLNSFLAYQVGQFQSLAEERGISLSFSSTCPDGTACIDEEKMQQIVGNLLSNALKYTPSSGWVSLKLQESTKDSLRISVCDNGPGIPEEAQAHIFDRFYQVERTERSFQVGTGIGLALCKMLVEQHGGSIEVKSKMGAGSCFEVEIGRQLERVPWPQTETEAESNSQPSPNAHRTQILVAEDHPDLGQYLEECLGSQYEVSLCQNGKEAWEKALDQMPDLVVSDLVMPQVDGLELTQRIKSDPRTAHIPVILLTAKSEQGAVQEGLKAGADHYLAKPFNSDELILRIENILKQREEWRKKLASLDLAKIGEAQQNSLDQAFISKLEAQLTENYHDSVFGVEDLAKAVGLSKTHLNRKLKALGVESANKLIQNFRLEKARAFLLKKEGNVSEIAFACGFNSAAYFSKCFKDKYHEKPGDLI